MKRLAPVLSLAVLLFAALPLAALSRAARAEEPKALFAARGCLACHGESGAKPIAGAPNLAGQNAAYLLRQMNEIAEEQRSTPALKGMKPFIHKAAAEDRKILADWLAAQKPAPAQPAPAQPDAAALVEKGSILFDEQGCIGCHGADGLKPLADYPILAGQRRDYLKTQITDIRDEHRSTRRVRLMVANVRQLKEDEVEALAAFLSQVKRN